ncbi:cytochrome c-type biogenesis protein [Rheinheimera lutimaris]|nr:cytochrome c-type biogenesis protein [Rheinheimera lutimaris]
MMRILGVLLLLCAVSGQAQEILSFENETERQLYQQLTAELRCPQCQNQNIADSHAIVAVDMRQKTYQLVREGHDRAQVLDYMKNRYGDFVHYQPPLNRYTLWLWLSPLLMLLALAGAGLYRRVQQVPQDAQSAGAEQQGLESELDQLIDRYRSKKE